MSSTGKYILGGLLAGVGEGMILQGKAKREAMLAELERQHDVMLTELRGKQDIEGRTFSAERDDAREASRQKFEGEQAEKERIEDRRKTDLDERYRRDELEYRKNGLLRDDDDDDLVEVADPDNPGRTIMVPKSRAAGMPGKSSTDALAGEQSEREQAAQAQAEEEAANKAVWYLPESSDFPEDGSREAFIERRKKEILSGKTTDTAGADADGGDDAPKGGGVDESAEQKPTGGKPKGAGTKQDPYKAVSQSDVDWFKQNAPKGAVLSANGKLYVK
jgi:hypothetical protein